MKLSLVLAIFWMAIGAGILVLDPPELRVRLGDHVYSTGWAALLLAAWNLVRWYGYRSIARQRQELMESERKRERQRREREMPPEERNPDFQFEDPEKR